MGTKSRRKPLRILSMLFLMTALLIPTTFATNDYNGTGENVGGGSGLGNVKIEHNWNNPPKGYRFYAAKENGTIVSDVVDLWFGDGTAEYVYEETTGTSGNSPKDQFNTYFNTARAVSLESSVWYGFTCEELLNESGDNQIPEPFMGFSQGGTLLEAWIHSTPDGADACNGLRLIHALFGEEVIEEYVNGEEEMYIIIETLTMFDILGERNEVIGTYAGSVYGWGHWQEALAPPQTYGNSYLRRGTNGVFAVSLMLEETWEGTNRFENMAVPVQRSVGGSASSGSWISASQMIQYGYGTHEYRFGDLMNQMTHTWDYPLGNTPGPAPKVEDGKEDKVTIVKVYCTKDSKSGEIISWDGSYIRTMNPRIIEIEDEEEYKVEEWKTSTLKPISAPSTWPPIESWPKVQGPSGGTGTVSLDPDPPTKELTLAVLLVKQEEVEEVPSELIIEESEISIYRTLSEVTDFSLPNPQIKWLNTELIDLEARCPKQIEVPNGSEDCDNPECTDCPHTKYKTVTCNKPYTPVDTRLYLKVKNNSLNSYSHVLAKGSSSSFKPVIIPKPLNGYNNVSVTTRKPPAVTKKFDYEFIAYRGRESAGGKKDDLTLSNYTVTGESIAFNNGIVKSLGEGYTEANKTTKTRWAQVEKSSIETEVNLRILLIQDDSGDYQFSGKYSCGHDSDTGKFTTTEKIDANGVVTIHSYAGKQKTAALAVGSPISSVQGCYKGNGYPVKDENLLINFYPYIHMTYETMGSNDKHDAAVLSQWKRSMTVNDYAEAGYVYGGQTLAIKSQQWSIHQMATKATDERPWAGQNKVLPGGAIYNVTNGSTGGNQIILRTYQVIVDHDSKAYAAMQAAGSKGLADHTRAVAEAKHQEYVNTALKVFNNGYYIEQVINEDPLATLDNIDSGNWGVVNGGDPGLSVEKKYYLYTDAANKVQSSLLQASASATTPVTYTFRSDTEGNIYMNDTPILKKDQSANEITNGKAKYINARTKVVSNLIGAIERNTGEDFTASWAEEDGAWYNEAFAITVLEQTSTLNVGLLDPAKRETVLDPALCPDNVGKSDYFSKAIASGYRMHSESVVALGMGKGAGYVSTFREQDVTISNLTGMFRSNTFVIPNVNVQDLKD